MTVENITPAKLILKLSAYFLALISAVIMLLLVNSDALLYLPLGGTHALQEATLEITESRFDFDSSADTESYIGGPMTPQKLKWAVLLLSTSLAGTILIMLPISWTYSATRFDSGPEKSFVRALIVLPICATTVVLLIQDSLALAFGLAALVAAVRFRVSLSEAIDGIYIFAAVCVGLAAGIGYLGVAGVMGFFFCMTNAVLWHLDYGKNPLDERRRKAKHDKLNNLN